MFLLLVFHVKFRYFSDEGYGLNEESGRGVSEEAEENDDEADAAQPSLPCTRHTTLAAQRTREREVGCVLTDGGLASPQRVV